MKTGVKQNPTVLIASHYNSMTRSEQRVAKYVNESMEEIVYLTVTSLAEKVGVGETTVLRFCRKLNYKGYQDFKMAIAQSLVSKVDQLDKEVKTNDSLEEISQKITQHNTKLLQDSLELLSINNIQLSAKAIIKSEQLLVFGIGSSGITALDAEHRLMRMGLRVSSTLDPHVMAMKATLLSPKDVVVGISTSGSTKDVVDAVRIAKESGAFVICITNHARSPITQYADIILLAASKESPLQGGAYSTKIAQLLVLDILTKVIELDMKDDASSAIQKTAESVIDKMY